MPEQSHSVRPLYSTFSNRSYPAAETRLNARMRSVLSSLQVQQQRESVLVPSVLSHTESNSSGPMLLHSAPPPGAALVAKAGKSWSKQAPKGFCMMGRHMTHRDSSIAAVHGACCTQCVEEDSSP